MSYVYSEESRWYKFLFANTKMAWFWLIVRIYVGWQWFEAGLEKVTNPAWVGSTAGSAMGGFIKGALAKATAATAHHDVSMWYAWFLQHAVQPYLLVWSHAIAYGELFVGIGLILGALTGLAAFFGVLMNLNYLLAGTVSSNPVLLILGIFIIMAHRVAGLIGLDKFLKAFLKRRPL